MGLIAVVFINLFAKAVIDYFPLVGIVCVLISIFFSYWSYRAYVRSGVGRVLTVVCILISECAFTMFLLLCIRDIALVAQDGILGAIGGVISTAITCCLVPLAKAPYFMGLEMRGTAGAFTNALLTPGIVALLCWFFEAIPALITMLLGR